MSYSTSQKSFEFQLLWVKKWQTKPAGQAWLFAGIEQAWNKNCFSCEIADDAVGRRRLWPAWWRSRVRCQQLRILLIDKARTQRDHNKLMHWEHLYYKYQMSLLWRNLDFLQTMFYSIDTKSRVIADLSWCYKTFLEEIWKIRISH